MDHCRFAVSDRMLTKAEFVRLIAGLCRLHRIAFSPELLLQHFPPDDDGRYAWTRLFDAADRFGLQWEEVDLDKGLPGDWFFPVVALPASQADGDAPSDASVSPVLLLRAEGEQIRCLSAGAEPPELPHLEPVAALRTRCHPVAWAFQPKPEAVRDADGKTESEEKRPFGFRWFVPELLRHRKVWRDILAASLALQLIGLSTPLLTQVVIDKVVVHQTQSTLTNI